MDSMTCFYCCQNIVWVLATLLHRKCGYLKTPEYGSLTEVPGKYSAWAPNSCQGQGGARARRVPGPGFRHIPPCWDPFHTGEMEVGPWKCGPATLTGKEWTRPLSQATLLHQIYKNTGKVMGEISTIVFAIHKL